VSPDPSAVVSSRLSVVIPAFGEERRIGTTVRRVRTALAEGGVEIVVVDDGSSDNTVEEAWAAGADQVVRLPSNRGKGAAVRAGMLASRGAAVVFTDADLAYAPSQIADLLEEIEKGWDVVVGNRHHRSNAIGIRDVGHRVFRGVTRLVLTRHFADTQCGLKGFNRRAADLIFSRTRIDSFAFDVEVLWLADHLGLKIEELPVELDRASDQARRSTVRLRIDAVRMLRDLLRIRRWAKRGGYGSAPASPPQ
jgi:glycosyltransferase involved in cell wall biosynthesis